MANKICSSSMLRSAPTAPLAPENEAVYTEHDQAAREQAGRETDDRFREALRRGETSGDFVVLDEHGNEIIDALPSKTIFDF